LGDSHYVTVIPAADAAASSAAARDEAGIVRPDHEHGESVGERAAGEQSDRFYRVVGRLVTVEDIGQGRRPDLRPGELLTGDNHDVGKQIRVLGRQRDGALPAVGIARHDPETGVVDDVQVRARPADNIR
jgi:hypothetical protein